ncbi:hypothetical protein Scep_010991 [Stephania cephalantha]|uniref:Uncharacterized protein n=1 Tax=Stephania cephalantha TaxID=152367 RepID=A0AAP0PHK8_9MAGN
MPHSRRHRCHAPHSRCSLALPLLSPLPASSTPLLASAGRWNRAAGALPLPLWIRATSRAGLAVRDLLVSRKTSSLLPYVDPTAASQAPGWSARPRTAAGIATALSPELRCRAGAHSHRRLSFSLPDLSSPSLSLSPLSEYPSLFVFFMRKETHILEIRAERNSRHIKLIFIQMLSLKLGNAHLDAP